MDKKIVIIGAGPAGLTAACELAGRGYLVTVLESDKQVGGISKTVNFEGNRMDLGGHRFFSKNPRVLKWWQDFLPLQSALPKDDRLLGRDAPVYPEGADPEKSDRVMLVRNRVSRIYYKNKFFDYPVTMKPETIRNMGLATTAAAGFSYLSSVARKLPEDSLENFYINRFGKKLYGMFFESYTEKLWGRHPRDISADWGAQRVKGLSVMAVLRDMAGKILPGSGPRKVETSLIEQFWYPKYGPGELWELAAEKFTRLGGTLLTGAEAEGIQIEGTAVKSVTYRKDGRTVTLPCGELLSSMPLKDLVQAFSGVEAPEEIRRISEGLPYRDYVTVGVLLPELALKNRTNIPTLGNIIPDDWIYIQDAGVKMGRIQIFNNWSPYMVQDPKNSVWVGLEYFCAENDAFWNMPEEECAGFAVGELCRMGIVAPGVHPLKVHRERVKKAYPAYFDTYSEISKLVQWLNGFENLYCIGRNGQHRYNNMDHSMVTAFEAVDNIVTGRQDKTNVWNVNTEKEYHEEAQR